MAAAGTKEPCPCTAKWEDIDREPYQGFPWLLLHQWAHSRTAFSVETLANRASVELKVATSMVETALEWKWLQRVATPGVTTYAGNLTRRR
ncbi:MAG TPA: hypothetical protein VJ140_05055 [Actinomycetota bacterium]|nr:hypothetical protein [Actinomycetota bacterium]